MPYINGNRTLAVVRTKYLNVDDVYPIGSVYISFNSTSPAQLFGGTWERISNKFLYGTSDDNAIGQTGGSNTHTHNINDLVALLTLNDNGTELHIDAKNKSASTWATNRKYIINSGSWTSASSNDDTLGTTISGSLGNGDNMPPNIKVAIWKRIADPQEE